MSERVNEDKSLDGPGDEPDRAGQPRQWLDVLTPHVVGLALELVTSDSPTPTVVVRAGLLLVLSLLLGKHSRAQ